MRHPVIWLLILVAATEAAAGEVPDAVAADIAAVEAQLEAGLANRDRNVLEPIIAEPFTWIHASDGRVDGRDAWLANAARGMALSGQRNTRREHGATLSAYGSSAPHTVIRVSRVQLLDGSGKRETWIRQTQTFVRDTAGKWQLASGQGVVMYEGPPLDLPMHERYAGAYVIDDKRKLVLVWKDATLLAIFPSGAQTQIFLASPTEEAMRNPAAGTLRFTLDSKGVPISVALVRAGQELWRGVRQ